jgi:ketosteroid isomerase-like protein
VTAAYDTHKEGNMGEARDILDQVTDAVMTLKDLTAVAACYSDDAVAITPDQGQITGRDGIVEYLGHFMEAFPDAQFDHLAKHESGNVAIDEGYFVGTNTGDLQVPGGESIPATGKKVRVRDCDIVVAEGGLIQEHRFYFDQMEFLGQLGLLPEEASG